MADPRGIHTVRHSKGEGGIWSFGPYNDSQQYSRVGTALLELDLELCMLQSNKRHNFIIDPRIMSYCISQAILRLEHCKQYTYSTCNLSNLSHSNKDQGGIYWSISCLLVPEQRKH